MRKVKNAIILAAGKGSRMVPLTYNLPKGLIMVKGETMIERQIKQLLEVEIDKIIIVTGYLAEKYNFLSQKYKGVVKLIYNPYYENKNNIYSLYLVREYLSDSYILSCDNYYSENIFRKEELEHSWYCGVKATADKSEWGIQTDAQGRIVQIKKTVQSGQFYMNGAVFFTAKFSKEFSSILAIEYENIDTHQYLWEELLIKYLNQLEIFLRPESAERVWEIDSFAELRHFDWTYQKKSQNSQIQLISKIFQVTEDQIVDLYAQKIGMTNDSFLFTIGNKKYIFRLPGNGSNHFINRQNEFEIYQQLKDLNITDTVIYFDPYSGIKISIYEQEAKPLTVIGKEISDLQVALKKIKQIHNSSISVKDVFRLKHELAVYEKELLAKKVSMYENYAQIKQQVLEIEQIINQLHHKPVLCHMDFWQENILVLPDHKIRIIDWEYVKMSDPMVDVVSLIISAGYSKAEMDKVARLYMERDLTFTEQQRLYGCAAIIAFYWSVWTKYKEECQGHIFNEKYGERMYQAALFYVNTFIELKEEGLE